MKNLKNTIIFFLFTMLPSSAFAATTTDAERLRNLDVSVAAGVPDGSKAIQVAAQSFMDRLPYILTILAFASLLYSGGMYVLAMGDTTKMEQAKKNLGWTAIGMVAMSLVLVGIRFITYIASQGDKIRDYSNL